MDKILLYFIFYIINFFLIHPVTLFNSLHNFPRFIVQYRKNSAFSVLLIKAINFDIPNHICHRSFHFKITGKIDISLFLKIFEKIFKDYRTVII